MEVKMRITPATALEHILMRSCMNYEIVDEAGFLNYQEFKLIYICNQGDLTSKMPEVKFSFASCDTVCNYSHLMKDHALNSSFIVFIYSRQETNVNSFTCKS